MELPEARKKGAGPQEENRSLKEELKTLKEELDTTKKGEEGVDEKWCGVRWWRNRMSWQTEQGVALHGQKVKDAESGFPLLESNHNLVCVSQLCRRLRAMFVQ